MKRTNFTMPPVIKRNGATAAAPDPARVQQFIEGGDQNAVTAAEPKSAVVPPDVTARVPDVSPWQDQDDKVRRPTFNIRLTNLEKACLEHINSKTPYSQHSFILSVLRPAIAAKMKELTGEEIESLLRTE